MTAVLMTSVLGTGAGLILFVFAGRQKRTALPHSWRIPLTLTAGLLAGTLAWPMNALWLVPALVLFAAFAVVLAAVDFRTQLLPNRLVLPFLVGAVVLLGLAAAFETGWRALLHAALGGAAMFVVYLVLALISPKGLGMGDVKLSAVVGCYAGFFGFEAWMLALLISFAAGGLAGVVLLASRRGTLKSAVPLGPSMLVGGAIGMIFG